MNLCHSAYMVELCPNCKAIKIGVIRYAMKWEGLKVTISVSRDIGNQQSSLINLL